MEKEIEKQQIAKELASIKSQLYINSKAASAFTINSIYQGDLDVSVLIDQLNISIDKVIQGDLRGVEEMLITQATTLNVFFHSCLAESSNARYMPKIQMFADLALRAQKEARKTLAVLVDIKNPRRAATFIKQQNNALNQQVNNETNSQNLENSANELLEVKSEQILDKRETLTASTDNPSMEALEMGRC